MENIFFKEDRATSKQLWKINELSNELFTLRANKLKQENKSTEGMGDYLTTQLVFPMTKGTASKIIPGMMELREQLKSYEEMS